MLPKPILDQVDLIDPISMTGLMFLINGVFFTVVIKGYNKFQKKNKSIASYRNLIKTKTRSFYFLIFAGLAEITATTIFYFGLRETSAANSAVLGNADILFTWILAFLVFRECIKRKELFPIGLILMGSIMLPILGDYIIHDMAFSSFVFGDLLVIFSGLFYGIEMILLKYVSEKINTARILEFISYIGGAVALCIAFLVKSPLEFNFDYLTIIMATAIFGIGISIFFMISYISYIGAIRTILIFSTTTIFGIIFAVTLLNETINSIHILAFVSVFAGIYLLSEKLTKE